ncbi:ExbD/TolR family protein [Pseudoduganella albidiflava]|uniref:Biopolymer transporter ExbD n=1 Tax=Pseudoduganella albidiflava TaxID=321983 RepID=A0A411WZW9_9BURK|nr:biopolymer transporter ExbD [Pseudoduganella albidiflava]QBI02249.1 biopolymer transporter ExbD [Pseudoduganella albidiflava]GGY59346.1 biopolymer transporter ExbD [Pseudoduganella albidiflava]
MRIDLGEDEAPEIGLVALIDCIFFLLMFFMVASSFKTPEKEEKPQKELPVVLPAAQMSLTRAAAAPSPLAIGVDKRGKYYLDGSKVGVQELHDRLKAEAAKNAQRPIRIDGDEDARYQDIVHVLDLCQFEGFTRISMRTRQ